ncbi:hypothetical protein E5H85_22100 [Escherichia coli]|nr:hypothetical protein [Escherichia coli]
MGRWWRYKWITFHPSLTLRLSLIKGRISRRLPVTTSSDTGVELLPVEVTLDERPYPVFYAR